MPAIKNGHSKGFLNGQYSFAPKEGEKNNACHWKEFFFFNKNLDYFLDLIILLASVMQPTFQIIISK